MNTERSNSADYALLGILTKLVEAQDNRQELGVAMVLRASLELILSKLPTEDRISISALILQGYINCVGDMRPMLREMHDTLRQLDGVAVYTGRLAAGMQDGRVLAAQRLIDAMRYRETQQKTKG